MLPSPRKLPKQSRSKLMFESIKQACHKILMEGDASVLNTNEIAEVTGISVGSLYQYFENVDSIVAALFCDLAAGMASSKSAYINRELKTLSFEDRLVFIVDQSIEFHRVFVGLHAEFYRKHRMYFDLEAELEKIDSSFAGFSLILSDSNFEKGAWQALPAISERTSNLVLSFVYSSLFELIESAPEKLFKDDIAHDISAVALSIAEFRSGRLLEVHRRRELSNEVANIWRGSRGSYYRGGAISL